MKNWPLHVWLMFSSVWERLPELLSPSLQGIFVYEASNENIGCYLPSTRLF